MPRPPPLQLQFDNMFPGAVRPRIQMQSFISGVYQSNWRLLVLSLTTINALRFFLAYRVNEALADLDVDIAQNSPQLARVSRTLVIIYTVACGIELFGAFSAYLQRRTLIRTYAYLAVLSAVLLAGAGVVITAAYFTFADDLIEECIALATAGQLASKSTFRSDPWPKPALSPSDAQIRTPPSLPRNNQLFILTIPGECLDVWSAESTSQVAAFALSYLLPSAFFCGVAYVYYRQAADPTHPANLAARGSAIRLEARGSGVLYEQLRDGDSDAPASGRRKRRPTVSPRSYQAALGVAPLAVTSGSSLSPGPPSFSVPDADAYHGFRLSAGSEDDAFI
ncbi:hypothetical protein DFH06DRAFT_1432247 [Mycena polygramma]|nr:hypothetical protein DFH06DRAFT_1432247 [Mycena polygramma]